VLVLSCLLATSKDKESFFEGLSDVSQESVKESCHVRFGPVFFTNSFLLLLVRHLLLVAMPGAPSSFLSLLVRHLLLEAMHLLLIAYCHVRRYAWPKSLQAHFPMLHDLLLASSASRPRGRPCLEC